MATAVLAVLVMLEMLGLGGWLWFGGVEEWRSREAEQQRSKREELARVPWADGSPKKTVGQIKTHSNEGINNNTSGVPSGHREGAADEVRFDVEIRSKL